MSHHISECLPKLRIPAQIPKTEPKPIEVPRDLDRRVRLLATLYGQDKIEEFADYNVRPEMYGPIGRNATKCSLEQLAYFFDCQASYDSETKESPSIPREYRDEFPRDADM